MSTVVRRLSDVDDIVFATGGLDGLTHGTFAFLLRPLAAYTSVARALLRLYDLGGTDLGGVAFTGNNRPAWISYAAGVVSDGPTMAASDDWYLLVVRKATGTATPRFSVRNLSTGIWTHEDGDAATADWAAPTGGAFHTGLILGSLAGPGSDYAAVAVWANELPWSADSSGDTQIEAAGLEDHLDFWRDADPSAGWAFGQDDNNLSVEDWTPAGTADEISTGIGTPTLATDLTFPYEDIGIEVLSRNYLRSTQTEPDATGIVRDLSETQGTPSTITSPTVSGGFTEVFRWHRVVGETVGSSVIDTQVQVTAVSAATLAYKWLVQRWDSSGVLQASSAESGEQNTTGIKVQSFILSTTWAAGDRLALSVLLRKAGGGGNRSITVAVNDSDAWAEFVVAAAPTFTGTLAVTEAADTLAASGTSTPPPISGTLAVTESADTLTASGTVASPGSTGTLSVTEASDTLAASGTTEPPAITGTLAATEQADTLAGVGTFTPTGVTGTLSVVEATDTLAAAGTSTAPTFTGSLAVTEQADSLTASGTVEAPIFTGALAITEAADILAASGTSSSDAIVGTLTVTEQPDVLVAAGTFTPGPVAGTLSVTEAADVLVATGTAAVPVFTGTLAIVQAADTFAASGTSTEPSATGTFAATEAADVLAASGTMVTDALVGTLSVTEAADVLVAMSTFTAPIVPPAITASRSSTAAVSPSAVSVATVSGV
jgi:hypothetical protein